jgi:acyl-CoA thioester hydrolase
MGGHERERALRDALPVKDIPPVETRVLILPEWTDANGHMNVAWYVLAFDRATDAFYDALGIGWSHLERERHSLFTLAMNLDYVREVFAGQEVRIASRLVDHDAKRLHYFHEMSDAADRWLAATNEIVAIHVDMATRRSTPFSDGATARLAAMAAAHSSLPRPPQLGRGLGIRRPRSGTRGGG